MRGLREIACALIMYSVLKISLRGTCLPLCMNHSSSRSSVTKIRTWYGESYTCIVLVYKSRVKVCQFCLEFLLRVIDGEICCMEGQTVLRRGARNNKGCSSRYQSGVQKSMDRLSGDEFEILQGAGWRSFLLL